MGGASRGVGRRPVLRSVSDRPHRSAMSPLRARPDAPKHEEAPRLTTELGQALARFLLAAPAQWAAFHPVWDDACEPTHAIGNQRAGTSATG